MRNLLDRQRTKDLARMPESGGSRAIQLYRPVGTQNWSEPALPSGRHSSDEVLIMDERASVRPAEWVERKLISVLKSVYLPMSHVRTTSLCNGRGHSSSSSGLSDRKMNGASSVGSARLKPEGPAAAPLYHS